MNVSNLRKATTTFASMAQSKLSQNFTPTNLLSFTVLSAAPPVKHGVIEHFCGAPEKLRLL